MDTIFGLSAPPITNFKTPKILYTGAIVKWSEPLKIRCHIIVKQIRETVEQRARKFRNLSLQVKEWTWVNCKLITASHQNSEPGFCAVWEWQGRIMGGATGAIARGPPPQGGPRDEIYLLQTKHSFEKFRDSEEIQEHNSTIIFLYCIKYQGPPTVSDFSTNLTVCQF